MSVTLPKYARQDSGELVKCQWNDCLTLSRLSLRQQGIDVEDDHVVVVSMICGHNEGEFLCQLPNGHLSWHFDDYGLYWPNEEIKMSLYRVTSEGREDWIEAPGYREALEVWHMIVKEEWGSDYKEDDQPDSVEQMMHDEKVYRWVPPTEVAPEKGHPPVSGGERVTESEKGK